ncbi:MAG TPA: Maf family protein [Candidatus Sumerlaeia bacterium]|nr:MAG: Maf-like protein YhdE [candidate division BRC1 bacterium ADurb.Bin183]HRR30949.1 Maf family protein [Candidatus Sumerlaeia bacterium]
MIFKIEEQAGAPPIILASVSPRRIELLARLGFVFETDASGVDESAIPFKGEREYAMKAALAKAKEVAGRSRWKGGLVIGADTIVCLNGEVLGKPRGREDARRMLEMLRGQAHDVITGVAVAVGGTETAAVDSERTRVFFKRFRRGTMEKYLAGGESLDKAGAYGIQGAGKSLVHHIEGDYFNVVGLPLGLLLRLLGQFINIEAHQRELARLRYPYREELF